MGYNTVIQIISDGIKRYIPRIPAGWWVLSDLVICMVAVWNWHQVKKRERTVKTACFSVLIVLYFLAVILVTFGTRLPDPHISYQLAPFYSYRQALLYGSENEIFEILCNVLLFLPFGVLLPLWKPAKARNLFQVLKYAFSFTFCIEFLQLITRIGCFEIDDMIHNTLGAGIGNLLLCAARKTKGLCMKLLSGRIVENGS